VEAIERRPQLRLVPLTHLHEKLVRPEHRVDHRGRYVAGAHGLLELLLRRWATTKVERDCLRNRVGSALHAGHAGVLSTANEVWVSLARAGVLSAWVAPLAPQAARTRSRRR